MNSHEKWLRQAAAEISAEGHAGWGNTCTQAADAIAELQAEIAKAKREAIQWSAELDLFKGTENERIAELLAEVERLKEEHDVLKSNSRQAIARLVAERDQLKSQLEALRK